MANYTCPPGYSCNDMKGWTCTANSTYPYPYPTSSAPQPSGRPDAAGRPKYEPDIDADVTAGDDDVDASYASDAGAD